MSQRQVLQGTSSPGIGVTHIAWLPDHKGTNLSCTVVASPSLLVSKYFSALLVFEQYQKSRTQFVQTVAELASRPQNIETLQNAGEMSLYPFMQFC